MDAISEKYQKYLIRVSFQDSLFFAVWGIDSVDQKDRWLIDESNRLILFTRLIDLNEFVNSPIVFFDKQIIIEWLKESGEGLKPYSEMSIDILSGNQDLMNNSDPEKLFYAISSLSDYFYQIQTEDLIAIYESEELSEFIDSFMDKYIWKGGADIQIDLTKIKDHASQIYSLMLPRVHIYKQEKN